MKEKFYNYYLYLTVFITGATVLMLEILGTRIMSPYFGSTLYVWSSLISVTIISLAMGYFLGGWVADKKPDWKLLYLFIFSIGLAILIIPKVDQTVLLFTNSFGLRFGPLVGTFILFTVPMVLLGMIDPFAIKLRAHGRGLEHIGMTAGGIFGVATVGSFVGAILTGFYLIPSLGVNAITNIFAVLLFILAAGWFLLKKNFKFLLLFLFVIPLLLIQPTSMESDKNKIVYQTQSMLGDIRVVDRGVHRILLVDGAVQSWVEKGSLESSVGFTKSAKFSFFLNPEIKNTLVLGLGSGSLSSELENQFTVSVDTVEIDPRIVYAAKQYFGFKGDVFIDDARHFMRGSDKNYDAILFDVSVGDAFPIHMYTKESFQEVRRVLTEGGILVVHMGGLIDSVKIKSLYKTIDSVFENVFVIKSGDDVTSGIAFFASDSVFDKALARESIKKYVASRGQQEVYFYIMDNDWIDTLTGGIVITDDYNPLDLWQIETMEGWRKFSLSYFSDILVE